MAFCALYEGTVMVVVGCVCVCGRLIHALIHVYMQMKYCVGLELDRTMTDLYHICTFNIQWKLNRMRSLGLRNLVCHIKYFALSVVKKKI